MHGQLKTGWPPFGVDLDAFRVVFLAGGGSIELQSGLRDIHPDTLLLDDSQFANVHGFMAVHRATVKTMLQEKVVPFSKTV